MRGHTAERDSRPSPRVIGIAEDPRDDQQSRDQHGQARTRRGEERAEAADEAERGCDEAALDGVRLGERAMRDHEQYAPAQRERGVDPSEYVVRKYGKRRNIRLGGFEDVARLDVGRGFDLIVCADMLQYIATPALERGIRHLASLLHGVAFLEAYTSGDDMEGDLEGWHFRSKAR